MAESKNKQPKQKFFSGNVSASVWENLAKNRDGEEFTSTNYQLDKNYKDKDGNWQNTNSFSYTDLQNLRCVIDTILSRRVQVK